MVRALLIRGMLAGAAAGLLACAFAWIFGEPQIDVAIGFEQHSRMAAGEAPEPELVSRAVQSSVGLLTGIVVYGSALGGIFSLVFAYAYGRLGHFSPRTVAAVLAALGFVTLILIPQIKYPAAPPSVGDPDTIATRTALFFTMIVLSIIASIAAVLLARILARRIGSWNGTLIGGAAYVIGMAIAMYILPPVNEVPADFPATTLWSFRLNSLGVELVLWTAMALLFGRLAERQLRPVSRGQLPPRHLARAR